MDSAVCADAAVRTVGDLLRDVARLDCASGRALVLARVQTMSISPEWGGPFARMVATTRSQESLIAAVELLAAHLRAHPSGSPPPRPSGGSGWLAARRVDSADEGYVLLKVTEILYAFMGHATAKSLVLARWSTAPKLDPCRVYLRTTEGLFVPDLRSLRAVRDHLGNAWFFPVNKSVLLRRGAAKLLMRDGNLDLVGVRFPNGSTEWLAVSRRSQSSLYREIGRRSRRPRGCGAHLGSRAPSSTRSA
jgi:hypothetical protein